MRQARGLPAGAVARPGRLRALAPIVVLVVPLALGAAAAATWAWWPCGTSACTRPLAAVWLLALLAAPTAIFVGLPFTAGPATLGAAAATSLVVWMGLGRWAAVRATRDVDASWRDVGAELTPMLIGVWAGEVAGLAVVALVLIR